MKILISVTLLNFFLTLANSKICLTPACQKAADFISSSVDKSVDPCTNFFEFACGNWKKHHPLEGSKSVITVSTVLNDQISEEIRHVLESKFDDETAPNSVKYAKYVYKKCMEWGEKDKNEGQKQLKEVLQHILKHKWGIGLEHSDSSYNWVKDYVNAQAAGISTVFKLSIQPDLKNVTANHFIIESVPFGLDDNELINADKNKQAVEAYKKLITDVAKEMYTEELSSGDELLKLIKKDAEDIVKLETKLAKLKQPIEDNRTPDKIYNPILFEQLQSKTQFDIKTEIFDPLFNKLNASCPVNLINAKDVNYLLNALKLIETIDKRVLKIYIGWRIVQQFLFYSTENFRSIKLEFDRVTRGVKSLEPRNTTCVRFTNENVNMGLSRLYVEKFFTVKEKTDAEKIVDFVQKAYAEIISNNTWLDSKTKKASLEKLEKMTKNVAFPKWLLQDDEDQFSVDEYYSLKKPEKLEKLMQNENYLLSLVVFNNLQMKSAIENFAKPNDFTKKFIPFPPAEVNAAYEPTQNSITIPAGILKLPFFDSGRPAALNFGGIGAVVGHEFTHGFDDEGRMYAASGNYKSWWSNKAISQFNELTKCFIEQYSSQKEPNTALFLNGKNTLGENMADSDGLREAWVAFKKHQEKEGTTKLAGISYSTEKLFFLAYAHTWCSSSTTQWLKNRILTNVHSPDKYRVNIVVSNLKEFSETFQCPLASPMNPEKRCRIW